MSNLRLLIAGVVFVCLLGAASPPASVHAAPPVTPVLKLPARPADAMGGAEFIRRTSGMSPGERDQAVVAEIERGNVPSFLQRLTPVTVNAQASDGRGLTATVWVTPDYLAIGSDDDFFYVPLNYYSATLIAARLGCVLPTPRIVDAIYDQSIHRLKPAPLPAGPLMGTNLYMAEHKQRVDAQRRGFAPGGLIAGHKKDLVLTNRLAQMPGRVAIYGWHLATGRPIQPLSLVHGARYVDYSHGLRLVASVVDIGGVERSIYDALEDSTLASALTREGVTPNAWGLMHPQPPANRAPAGTLELSGH
ncbi:MAG: hypothetical protein KA385_12850 [Vicinamibacteria bacterium]|jgi:hypothetical protein|nr:hypothetical protein [Vicinamibacteria bacterium]